MLVAESEGDFTIEEWDQVASEAEQVCLGEQAALRASLKG